MSMTVEEALEVFNSGCNDIYKVQVATHTAIQAISEIQQYRAIGTVEELRENKNFLEFLYNTILPNEMEQYLSMYHAKDKTVTNGYADQSGLMPAT